MALEFTWISNKSGGKYKVTIGTKEDVVVGKTQKAIIKILEKYPDQDLEIEYIVGQFTLTRKRILYALKSLQRKFRPYISLNTDKSTVIYRPNAGGE